MLVVLGYLYFMQILYPINGLTIFRVLLIIYPFCISSEYKTGQWHSIAEATIRLSKKEKL